MRIGEQLHCIRPTGSSKIEVIKLEDLFSTLNQEGIMQIIRFNSDVYNLLSNRLEEGKINLFNQINPNTNSGLIENFTEDQKSGNDKGLVIEITPEIISGVPLPVLVESSIRVVQVLEMSDLTMNEVIQKELYKKSINKPKTFEVFKAWFVGEFEKGRLSKIEFEQFNQLFYRKIKLLNN